ncbi:GntR family transcriptional regulator [Alicyclobacillus fastidiosus]|uniref:GntR family transcriptional regulator n=1 Tax=Alicyclobacillus fastidiosus TaxID=392011 RepID=A0ABV5ABA0_9BACL|nr:GntR family transcriptional regulator [Alicyclobacillus fastidiosus]WEH10480.1 GntR family transcriptional regulator [Alicyclobacillus fastidiosus]
MRSGPPLRDEIYESIRSRILSSEFSAGKQLPTEKQLSESLHVSRITVHRALQKLAQQGVILRYPGKGSFVSDDAVEILNRHSGDSLTAKDQPMLIGFTLPNVSEDFGMEVLASALGRAEHANASVVVSFTHQSQAAEEQSLRRAVHSGVQGLLINPVNGEYYNDEILRLHLDGFPLVLVDKRLGKIPVPSVTTDNKSGAYDLTSYLIELGHRHIGFISPDVTATATLEDRFTGYLAALDHHKIPYQHTLTLSSLPTGGVHSETDGPEVYDAIRTYLTENRDVSALITTEYVYAVIVLEVCEKLGRRVPKDLSLACFDSPKRVFHQTLTHIKQDQARIGACAVDILIRLMAGGELPDEPSVQLPGILMVGDSTAAWQEK